MPAKGPIVIVGGGIASLSLARVLKARKIPSIVLERLGHASRIKDYGMGLRKWAYEPLSQRMGISASEFRARTAVDALVGGLGNIGRPLLNGRKGDPVEGESRSDLTTAEDDYYQASYAKVQDLLCQGLDVRMDHDVQALTPMANVARVLCRQNMVKSTLEIIEGPIVVVADGQYSNSRRDMGMHHLPWCFPLLVITGSRIIPRSVYEAEIRPYLEHSTIVSAAIANWRLCTFLDWQTDNTVEVRSTYSRLCQDMPEYHKFYTDLKNQRYQCSQSLDANEQKPLHIQLMRSRRDFKQQFHTRIKASTTIIPAVTIGDAALLMPVFLGDGASHAILDAVQLGDVLGSSYHHDHLQTVPHRFYDVAYYRWFAGVFDWGSRIKSSHGCDHSLKLRWQPISSGALSFRDRLSDCLTDYPNYSGTSAKNPEHLMVAEETRQRAILFKSGKAFENNSVRRLKSYRNQRWKSSTGLGARRTPPVQSSYHLNLSPRVETGRS